MPVGRWRTFLAAHTLMYTYVHIIERMTAQSAAGVHVCARAHTCMLSYAPSCIFTRKSTCIYARVQFFINVRVPLTLLSAHTRDSARICMICAHMHVCANAHVCAHTHTHTHTPAHHCVYMPKSMLINTCEPIECRTGSAGMCPYGMCVKYTGWSWHYPWDFIVSAQLYDLQRVSFFFQRVHRFYYPKTLIATADGPM